jgi:hypothetical protein
MSITTKAVICEQIRGRRSLIKITQLMEQEKELTGQESLELISRMISKARRDYYDTGLSSLLWGSTITFCSLVTFVNYYLQWSVPDYVWFLTIGAGIAQGLISAREKKDRRRKGHDEDLMSGIWISFAIAVCLLSLVVPLLKLPYLPSLYMIIYGIPTFTTGYGRRFRPMVIGGLACWVFAILAVFTPFPYAVLYLAASAQLAWFIPGLLLRKRYLKASKENV